MNLEHSNTTGPSVNTAEAVDVDSPAHAALNQLIATTDSIAPAILRIAVGGVMLPHALQKTLGLFGGGGWGATMASFTTQLHLPWLLGVAVILFEQLGALALVLGLFTRAAAVAIGIVMVGAVLTVHLQNGFFMNWFGNQTGEGYEFHLLVLAMVVALVLQGGGKASIDGVWSRSRIVS